MAQSITLRACGAGTPSFDTALKGLAKFKHRYAVKTKTGPDHSTGGRFVKSDATSERT